MWARGPLLWGVGLLIFPAALTLLSLQVEYKYDKEIMKGCVIPVVDDKLTLLALKNNEMNSYVRPVLTSPVFFS